MKALKEFVMEIGREKLSPSFYLVLAFTTFITRGGEGGLWDTIMIASAWVFSILYIAYFAIYVFSRPLMNLRDRDE